MAFKFNPKKLNGNLTLRIEKLLKTVNQKGCLVITQVGEAVLREQCKALRGDIEPRLLHKLIQAMKTTMREAPGVGLAATQIGLNIQLAVIEDVSAEPDFDPIEQSDPRETYRTEFFAIINPSYEPLAGDDGKTKEVVFYEGCLSMANYYALRWRYHKIMAYWTDEKGRDHKQIMTGWPARIFQHETDHLSGEIYIDKAIIRSIATADNLSKFELDEHIGRTAKEFGFDL